MSESAEQDLLTIMSTTLITDTFKQVKNASAGRRQYIKPKDNKTLIENLKKSQDEQKGKEKKFFAYRPSLKTARDRFFFVVYFHMHLVNCFVFDLIQSDFLIRCLSKGNNKFDNISNRNMLFCLMDSRKDVKNINELPFKF